MLADQQDQLDKVKGKAVTLGCTQLLFTNRGLTNIYLDELGQGSVEEKEGLVETMAESGEFE